MSKHIAASGAKAGQWVNCPAKQNCRNGGTHVSSETLSYARMLHQEQTGVYISRITEIPLEVVENYLNADAGTKKHAQELENKRTQEVEERARKRAASRERTASVRSNMTAEDRARILRGAQTRPTPAPQTSGNGYDMRGATNLYNGLYKALRGHLDRNEIENNTVVDKDTDKLRFAINENPGLTEDQRSILLLASYDMLASVKTVRNSELGQSERMPTVQALRASQAMLWYHGLRTHIESGSSKAKLENYFGILETMYRDRLGVYKANEAKRAAKEAKAAEKATRKPFGQRISKIFKR